MYIFKEKTIKLTSFIPSCDITQKCFRKQEWYCTCTAYKGKVVYPFCYIQFDWCIKYFRRYPDICLGHAEHTRLRWNLSHLTSDILSESHFQPESCQKLFYVDNNIATV